MRMRTLALLAAFLLPLPLLADTYTYTYTGNDYTYVNGSYTTSDFVSATFTLSAPLVDNLSFATYVTPLTWSFSDGFQSNNSTELGYSTYFQFSTNAGGQIVNWSLQDNFGSSYKNYIDTSSTSDAGSYDFGLGYGQVQGNPGSWTVTDTPAESPVPEGPSYVYLLLGVACLGGFMFFDSRKRFRATATA
jgi:hypothetical protein